MIALATMTTKIRYLPALVVMATIFSLSNMPGDQIHPPHFLDFDKFWHALEYAILAITLLYAKRPLPENSLHYALVFIFCVVYGITDEIHQSFIPLRFASAMDVCADGFGALLAVSGWKLVNSWR